MLVDYHAKGMLTKLLYIEWQSMVDDALSFEVSLSCFLLFLTISCISDLRGAASSSTRMYVEKKSTTRTALEYPSRTRFCQVGIWGKIFCVVTSALNVNCVWLCLRLARCRRDNRDFGETGGDGGV